MLSRDRLFSPQDAQDDGIYWQINLVRFHQHFRDQAIISAVSNKLDQVGGVTYLYGQRGAHSWVLFARADPSVCFVFQTSSEIVRTMLRMSEVTTSSIAAFTQPLSSNEVSEVVTAPPPAMSTVSL